MERLPAPVTFSVNGTSTSNSTTATFTKSGAYTFRIVVTDSAGLSTTNTLAITVNQTLTTITVTANGGAIVKNTWQKCTATAYDQFGNAMTTQPTFIWSVVSGGGSFPSAGLYQHFFGHRAGRRGGLRQRLRPADTLGSRYCGVSRLSTVLMKVRAPPPMICWALVWMASFLLGR